MSESLEQLVAGSGKGKDFRTQEGKARSTLALKQWHNEHPKAFERTNNPNYQGGKTRQCPICRQEFWVRPSLWNRKKTCSEECDKEYRALKMQGTKLSKTVREKISLSHIGSKNPAWCGGSSFEPYPSEFNKVLRRRIRERDNYTCQKCGEWGNCVHHINYDKMDCKTSNLITLCNRCNGKVNTNRDHWEDYFHRDRGRWRSGTST